MVKRRPLTRKQQTQKQKRKQKGGFYPSVMGGIGNAAYLVAPAIRMSYKLLKNKKRKTRKRNTRN
jgi:hypothetical protein